MPTRLITALAIFIILGLSILEWRPWHKPASITQPASTTAGTIPGTLSKVPTPEPSSSTSGNTTLRAQLTAVNYTTLAAEIGAKVSTINFKEGDSFVAGQVLMALDCSIQTAQLQRAQASFNIAERNYLANRKLLNHGAVSRLEVENAESEFQKTKAELAELTAVFSKCKIVAPFNGKVVEQRIRPEQYVQAGQALMELLDQAALEVEFIAPSSWYTSTKKNDVLTIRIDETGKTYPIRVERIGAKIDAVSQTMKIIAVIDGKFEELSPGMSGSINAFVRSQSQESR
jgi:RND family efflux transporter MFP subunit